MLVGASEVVLAIAPLILIPLLLVAFLACRQHKLKTLLVDRDRSDNQVRAQLVPHEREIWDSELDIW